MLWFCRVFSGVPSHVHDVTEMNVTIPSPSLICCLLCAGLIHAQELPADMAAEVVPASTQDAPPVREIVQADTPAKKQAEKTNSLSPAEQRIRAGIIMLGKLHELMSGIKDHDTAEAAIAPVMRLAAELNTWAQGFTALPPMNELEQAICEDQYLPIIRKLNAAIKLQGERLAAAEYYGSQHLPAALVKLALLNQ